MTQSQLDKLLRAIGRFVQGRIEKCLQPILAREAKHVARIAALEERQKAFRYRGTWDAMTVYYTGNFATHDGSLFHCNVDGTTQRPGNGGDWQLAVKHGRDARERAA